MADQQNNAQTAVKEQQTNEQLSTADLARAAESRPTPANNTAQNAPAGDGQGLAALLPKGQEDRFRSRWDQIQIGFVDEPRKSVEQADQLVAEVMKQLAETFAQERSTLEKQWGQGQNVSTEDLRQALRRYRSFFDRLLSV